MLDHLKEKWLILPILLYVLGMVVHNVYLAGYGIHDFELLEARYIVSGFGFVGFCAICFAYTSIRVNLSYIPDSFSLDRLAPWVLRVASLPYVMYSLLYGRQPTDVFVNSNVNHVISVFSAFAHVIVFYTIQDIIFMTSDGDSRSAKVLRAAQRILALPMVLVTAFLASQMSDFGSITKASTFAFFGFMGIAMYQADSKHGVETTYLDNATEESHENLFQIFFGAIAIFVLLWLVGLKLYLGNLPENSICIGRRETSVCNY